MEGVCGWFILLQFCLLPLPGIASAAAEKPVVKIGVLAYRGNDATVRQWGPTVDYIRTRVREYDFRLVPLDLHRLPDALAHDELGFVLTNPGNYVELEASNGITRIATLRNVRHGRVSRVFGGVVFCRADRSDIHELRDLRGMRFAAVDKGAFGGFQMAWRELKQAGVDPFRDFRELRFTGFPQDRIVLDVRDGRADAGTVRTDVLEGMASQGIIRLADFRVLNERHDATFPFRHSTRLYPEWAFAKARKTPEVLASAVTVALLQMAQDDPAARAGEYAGWTVPLDYEPVHEMFRELGIGPFAIARRIALLEVLRRYWYWLALMTGGILLSVAVNILIKRQVITRTAELSQANRALQQEIVERKRAEEDSRALLQENRSLIRKSLAVQESERRHLARELHDELGQCITAIQADVAIIRERSVTCDNRVVTSARAIQDVSARIYEVVHSMMHRLRPPMLDDLGLVETLRGEVAAWQGRQPETECVLTIGSGLDQLGEQLNMTLYRIVQECLTNVAKHAGACRAAVELHRVAAPPAENAPGMVRLVVRDDGRGFEPAQRCGSGLGLIGMRERVEGLDGTCRVVSAPGAGTTVTVELPLTSADSPA
jgi:two-component system sensor histidine kinase TtrS